MSSRWDVGRQHLVGHEHQTSGGREHQTAARK